METAPTLLFTETPKFKISLAVGCSLFIYLFLVFFQPFGVNNYRPESFPSMELLVGLSPMVFLVCATILINEFFIRPKIVTSTNTGPLSLWFVYEFIAIGTISFFIYNFLGGFHDFSLPSYFKHVLEVSSILIFPFFAILFFYRYRVIERKYEEALWVSKEQSNQNELVLITGDYKKDEIALEVQNMLFIEAEDNYVGLHFQENGVHKKYLIRSTLTKMEKQFTGNLIIRCHRSFIVNLYKLESFKTRSGNLFLKLKLVENEIPVSKSFKPEVRLLLEKHHF
jgi:hypothetical protein